MPFAVVLAVPLEGEVTSILTGAWNEVTYGIGQIMSQPVAALGLTLPIVGIVIGVGKRLFRSKRG